MNIEEIKRRLMKMKVLANAGVGGERANAEKLLVELAEKYGINLDEFEDVEEIVEYKFNFSSTWQRKLLSQLVGLMRQEKKKRSAAKRCAKKNSRFIRGCLGAAGRTSALSTPQRATGLS